MTFSTLGIDIQTGQRVDIAKTARLQGLYIIGAPGMGKTGLIENLIIQDIEQGIGICLLDPHGDLTQAVLSRIPDTEREEKVILLDIADEESPFGLNIFACDNPNSAKAVQYVVDQVMHIFDKLFDVSRATPLLTEYLRNCTSTLVSNPGFTMAEIPLLLLNEQCRKKLVANVTDQDVLLFWQQYEQMKASEQREEAASTLRRIREFLQPLTRNIVGQSKTTIDFRSVMDERKILLVKLDARLPSVTSLIGSVIVALFLNAAYSRATIDVKKRKQFHLYADEFQRFATEDFATLITEARKFGIATTIAHQMRDQLDQQNRSATLNVANVVVFKVSGKDAEELAGEFDSTPPPPEVIGQKPIVVPTQDAIKHLLTNGHSNVNALAFQFYLQVFQEYTGEHIHVPRMIQGHDLLDSIIVSIQNSNRAKSYQQAAQLQAEAKMMVHDLNSWFYAGMLTRNALLELPVEIFWTAAQVCFFEKILLPLDRHQQEIRMLCSPYVEEWEKTRPTLVKASYPDTAEQLQRCLQFLHALRLTFSTLATEPIFVDSGQVEPMYDKPRTYADVQNEIATRLANLSKFTARVKLIEADGKPVEYTLKALSPERGFKGIALQDRIQRIQNNNLREGYIKDKKAVADEIMQRQSLWSQQGQPLPQQSRSRGSIVCRKCKTQNRTDAKFCNQCGGKV